MAVVDARTWVEHLSQHECWELLAAAGVGRIGVTVDGAPEIYPLNFVVADHSIVFRTDVGSKLRSVDRFPTVCFEADGFDLASRTGWSVLVKGRAEEVLDASRLHGLRQLPLEYWTVGEKTHWIRIEPIEVTGRRVNQPS
ncbi:MAG TPA: pyridoxamine 5'-phosphate oxidase family protein [Acidimicrobiales bacterium]|nr:pyridoxamine 5'-phosphate oxidase family protein [Acidimicrobiales bacterium]